MPILILPHATFPMNLLTSALTPHEERVGRKLGNESPRPLTPALSPDGGEGGRRPGEGDRFMARVYVDGAWRLSTAGAPGETSVGPARCRHTLVTGSLPWLTLCGLAWADSLRAAAAAAPRIVNISNFVRNTDSRMANCE
jgi:hypothetical protein